MGLKKFFRLKNTVPWTYVISDNKGEEFVGKFYDKELRKKTHLRIEKTIDCILNGKATINIFNS